MRASEGGALEPQVLLSRIEVERHLHRGVVATAATIVIGSRHANRTDRGAPQQPVESVSVAPVRCRFASPSRRSQTPLAGTANASDVNAAAAKRAPVSRRCPTTNGWSDEPSEVVAGFESPAETPVRHRLPSAADWRRSPHQPHRGHSLRTRTGGTGDSHVSSLPCTTSWRPR